MSPRRGRDTGVSPLWVPATTSSPGGPPPRKVDVYESSRTPSTPVLHLPLPPWTGVVDGTRVDSGVVTGDTVSGQPSRTRRRRVSRPCQGLPSSYPPSPRRTRHLTRPSPHPSLRPRGSTPGATTVDDAAGPTPSSGRGTRQSVTTSGGATVSGRSSRRGRRRPGPLCNRFPGTLGNRTCSVTGDGELSYTRP